MSDHLFDLSAIDLNAVRLSSEALSEYLPQRGCMRHLDRVVMIDDACSIAVGIKDVRDDEFWVPGHIPGRPLLPGVIMIEAAAQLSSVLYQFRLVHDGRDNDGFLGFTRVDNGSFRGQVEPGDQLVMLVKEEKFQRRRFSCFAQGWVKDRMAFEVKCTGMRI
jgi:3-hydroxyacyl-[acyl-carrier-protein] dehydratase